MSGSEDSDSERWMWTWFVPETVTVFFGVLSIWWYSPSHALTFLLGGGMMLCLINLFGFDERYQDTES